MDEISHTVVLGPINDHLDGGGLMTYDDWYNLVMSFCTDYPDNHFYLVGRGFSKFGSLTACTNVTLVPDDASRVFTHDVSRSRGDDVPSFLAPVDVSPFTEKLLFLKSTDDSVVFMYNDPRVATNAFEVLSLTKTNKIENRGFVKMEKEHMGRIDIYSVADIYNAVTPEARKEASEMIPLMPTHEQEAFKALLLEGIDFVIACLTAGYHVRENRRPVPGWCLQVNGRWISLLISMFQMKTMSSDLEHRQEIVMYAAYRESLVLASISVLSNFITQTSGIVSAGAIKTAYSASPALPSENSPPVAKEWSSVAVWSYIRNEVDKINFR